LPPKINGSPWIGTVERAGAFQGDKVNQESNFLAAWWRSRSRIFLVFLTLSHRL